MVICRCSNTPRTKLLVAAYVDDVLLSGPEGYPRWWFQIFFIFIPTWGRFPNLTDIFRMGWNHQPESEIWETVEEQT